MALNMNSTQKIVVLSPDCFGSDVKVVLGAPVESEFSNKAAYERCLNAWKAYVGSYVDDVNIVPAQVITRVYKTDKPLCIGRLSLNSFLDLPVNQQVEQTVNPVFDVKNEQSATQSSSYAKKKSSPQSEKQHKVGGKSNARWKIMSDALGRAAERMPDDFTYINAMMHFVQKVAESGYRVSNRAVAAAYTQLSHEDWRVDDFLIAFPSVDEKAFRRRLSSVKAQHRKNLRNIEEKIRKAKRLAVEDVRLDNLLVKHEQIRKLAADQSNKVDELARNLGKVCFANNTCLQEVNSLEDKRVVARTVTSQVSGAQHKLAESEESNQQPALNRVRQHTYFVRSSASSRQ